MRKLLIAAMMFRAIWSSPASPPRKIAAPTMFAAMKAKATGNPVAISTTNPPSSSSKRRFPTHDSQSVGGRRRHLPPVTAGKAAQELNDQQG